MPLLDVRSLKTYFYTDQGTVKAVDDVSFHVDSGEIVALVGESGCGKTVSVYSIMRLIRPPGHIVGGEMIYDGANLLKMSEKEMARLRGKEISIVFQEASAAFDPVFTIGYQIREILHRHNRLIDQVEARRLTKQLLEMVNIPDADRRMNSYPFEFSGGMLQRAMIASAISCQPRVLIADEPTTSVDASTQLQLLELMQDLVKKSQTALIFITHNLGLVGRYAGRVYVLYAGKVVESASVEEMHVQPLHPYTKALWACVPSLDRPKSHRLRTLAGYPPSLTNLPLGCSFAPRCEQAKAICLERTPVFTPVSESHAVACHEVG